MSDKKVPQTKATWTDTWGGVFYDKERKLTVENVIFCWRVALHGNKMRAVRESYRKSVGNRNVQNVKGWKLMQHPKVREYIAELIASHKAGDLDLRLGPWQSLGIPTDTGNPVDPGNAITPFVADVRRLTLEKETFKEVQDEVLKND